MEKLKVKIAPGLNLIVTASVQGSLLRQLASDDDPSHPGDVEKDVIDAVRDYLADCEFMGAMEDALDEEDDKLIETAGPERSS